MLLELCGKSMHLRLFIIPKTSSLEPYFFPDIMLYEFYVEVERIQTKWTKIACAMPMAQI